MLDSKSIQKQLEKILKSPAFETSLLLRQFLQYIVEQYINGNKENIKAYNIAVEAFGRNKNFDAEKDTIVRITAGKLRKDLATYYAEFGKNDLVKITIPKGAYQPKFEIIKEPMSKFRQSILQFNFKIKNVILIILFGFVSLLFYIYILNNKISNRKPVIFFFEIKNVSSNIEDDIWSKGITEDISILSSRFSEIDIYGPLDNGKEKIDLNNFKKNDNLFAFNGNINKSDSLFLLDVRLTNFRTGKFLWGKSYRIDLQNNSLIDVEYEVCNDISKKIGSIYGVVQNEAIYNMSKSNPAKLSSHKSILQYYKYLKHLTYDEFLTTKKSLTNTVKNDPNYGVAWSALAAIYINDYLSFSGDSLISFTKAHQYIDRALQLDPNNVLVQNNLAYIAYMSKQINEFKKAVSKVQNLNPTNIMNGENGLYLIYLGESEQGLNMIKKATKYAIDYPGYFHAGPFLDYYRKGKYKEALVEANSINIPGDLVDPLCRSLALVNLKRMDDAIKAKKELLKLVPEFNTKGRDILSKVLLKKDIDKILNDMSKIKIESNN